MKLPANFKLVLFTSLFFSFSAFSKTKAKKEIQFNFNGNFVMFNSSISNYSIIPKDTVFPVNSKIYNTVEFEPKFIGGQSAMYKWVSNNVNFPGEMMRKNISGKVYVRFVITDKGKAVNPEILKSPHDLFSQEVIRLVESMPNWQPGYIDKKPVNTYFTMPVTFSYSKPQGNKK